MKKILKINALIMLLFSTILMFFNFKNSDSLYWMNWGQTSNSQNIYLRNTGFSGSDLYTLLTVLAEEMEVNLIKTDYLMIDNQQTTVKSIYIEDEQDSLFQDISIIDGEELTKLDNQTDYYVSSKNTEDSECIGRIFDFLEDDYVQIWTLTRFANERGSLDGDYVVRSHDTNNISNFIDELSQRSGISVEKLTTQTTFTNVIESSVESISKVGLVMGLITFAILSIYYAVNSSKKIGVMKINGYKNITIWEDLTVSIFATVSIFTILLDALLVFLLKNNTRQFMFSLFKIQCLIIIILFVTSFLIYFIIKRNTISNLIKNKKNIKHVVWMSYFLKCLVVGVFGVLSLFIGYNLSITKKEYDKMAIWNDVSELGVLVNLETGEDAASISQGDTTLEEDFAKYYDYLDNKGAIYTNVYTFSPHVQFKTNYIEETGVYDYVEYFDPSIVEQNFTTTTYKININYLKEYPLYDVNGEKIEIQDTDERVILIPESQAENQEVLEEVYKAEYIDEILSDQRRKGIETNEIPDVTVTSIIYKEDAEGYFSFSEEFSDDGYKVYAPIFEVLTQQNMTLGEKSMIYVQGIQSPLKLQLNMTSSEYNASIQSELAEFNLDDNNLKYMTIGEVFATQINTLKNIYMQYVIGLIITYIVIIFMTLHLTKLAIESKKKIYCIKKLYGYKFLDRFKKLLCIGSIMNILSLGIAYIIGPQIVEDIEITSLSVMIILVYILVDVFVYALCIKFFENKSISQLVKGE